MMSFRAISAAGVLSLVASGPALGAWTPPELASKGPLPARSPAVALNARGDGAAVWVRGSGRDAAIVVSLRAEGGTWSEPEGISRRGRPAIDPAIAVDAQGRVIVVWRQVVRTRLIQAGGRRRRQAVYVARARERLITDARWSAITTLSNDRQKVGTPEVGVGDDGLAVVAWHWGTGNSPEDRGYVGQVQVVDRRADGTWSGPRRLSRSPLCGEVRLPRVAVGSQGHAVVWWQCDLPGGRSTALSVSRPPGLDFGTEAELPFRTVGDVAADVVVGADGRAIAVSAGADGRLSWWRGAVGPTLSLDTLPVLGVPDAIDPATGSPQVAVNAAGDALSAWVDSVGHARTAPIAANLGVGSPAMVGMLGQTAVSARVAVGDARRGAIAWIADGSVMATTRAGDGTVPVGEAVSQQGVASDEAPALAMDPAGETVLLWAQVVGGRSVIERSISPAP